MNKRLHALVQQKAEAMKAAEDILAKLDAKDLTDEATAENATGNPQNNVTASTRNRTSAR